MSQGQTFIWDCLDICMRAEVSYSIYTASMLCTVTRFITRPSRHLKTVMLRGDIYSIPAFYHITNGNHPVINTKHKRDFIPGV